MATKKPKQEVRFANLFNYHQAVKNNIMDIDQVKNLVGMTSLTVSPKEAEKMVAKYEIPEQEQEQVIEFLKEVGALKSAGKGGGNPNTKLDTEEKMDALGVKPEDREEYLKLIAVKTQLVGRLNELCPNGRVSFAIPLNKKEDETPVEGEENS